MKTLIKLMVVMALFSGIVRTGFSRGDKVIPQVVAGGGWDTHFDLTNISSDPNRPIRNMTLSFYTNIGAKWTVTTNKGTGSDFSLQIGSRQTVRYETTGGATTQGGYAVITDNEPDTSEFSDDYVLGISVFYTQSDASGLLDTVTVSVPQPTSIATIPVQTNNAQGINSGLAIVNRSGASNKVTIALYNENGTSYGSNTFTLAPNEQRAEYLWQNLFTQLETQSQKGMAEITAQGPCALLGLLQTTDKNGNPQYSTLVPVDKESLKRNTYIYLLQASSGAMPLDLDGFVVDFYRTGFLNPDTNTEWYAYDLTYEYGSSLTSRYLRPWAPAQLAPIGVIQGNADQVSAYFDKTLSLPYLRGLNYSSSDIDLSGSNFQINFMFAVRTDMGNFAKARIIDLIERSLGGQTYQDIVLEVVIYK